MKKLSLILASLLAIAFCSSCQKEVVEHFDKPTDVVNPNPPAPPTVYEYGLKDLASEVGLKLGAAFTHSEYYQDDSVAVLLKRDFAAVTFGNEMKHDAIVSSSGVLKFTTADEMVDWAAECGTELFGHNLGWHQQQNYDYLNSLVSKAAADNDASLFQDNWNFESGAIAPFSGTVEITGNPSETFVGYYAAYAGSDGATLTTPAAAVENGKPYILSFWAKGSGDVKIESSDAASLTAALDEGWLQYSATIKAKSDEVTYTVTLPQGACIDNIRLIEGVEEEPEETGGNYINPYTIVEGGDFEAFTVGAIGQNDWSAMNGGDVLSIVEDVAHSGTKSLCMDNSADYAGSSSWKIQAASPVFTIDPTKTYRVGWYAKANVECDLQIDIRWAVSSTEYKSSSWGAFDKCGEDWVYQYVDVTPADEGDNTIQICFYGGTAVAKYWIDDFQIFEAVLEGDYTNYIDKNNLLEGGDFETNYAWGVWNGSDYASVINRNSYTDENGEEVVSVNVNADKVHSALKALYVDNSEGNWSGGDGWHIQIACNNKAAVKEGEEYRIGFWAKSPDGYETIQVEAKWDDGTTNYIQIPGITSDWTFVYVDKVAPAGATELQLVFDAAYSVGHVYVDDVQVYPKPVETCIDPATIVDDGDFESYADVDALKNAGWQVNGADHVSIVTDAHHGKQAVCMDNTDEFATNGWDIQIVTKQYVCDPGKTYRIAWQGKADIADLDMQIDIRMPSGTSYKSSAWGQYDKMQDSWTYQYIDVTTADGDDYIQVGFYGGGSANKIIIDCLQIFPVEASTAAVRASAGYGKYAEVNYIRPEANEYSFVRNRRAANTVETSDKTTSELAADRIDYAYKSWIYGMVEHFDVYGWDVINEAFTEGGAYRVSENTEGDGLFFYGDYYAGGKAWVERAFEYTADALSQVDKTADLYINDYNLETSSAKLDAICSFASGNDNVTGIGTQMHISATTDKDAIKNAFEKLAATGKKVRVSELDIIGADESERAAMYVYVFDQYLNCIPEAQRGGITIWGISDKNTWLSGEKPLLWDSKYEKKDSYEQLYLYLRNAAGKDPVSN